MPEKRRNYFIDKQFQTKFIVKFCFINIAASALMGVLIYWLNRQTKTVAFENLKVVVKTTADFIQPILLMVVVMVTLCAAAVTIVVVLFASHRIAGPLFRLTRELEKIRSKDFSHPIHIRATDQLKRLAAEFENMRREYRVWIQKAKQRGKALQAACQKGRESVGSGEAKRRLEQEIDDWVSELEQFKTE